MKLHQLVTEAYDRAAANAAMQNYDYKADDLGLTPENRKALADVVATAKEKLIQLISADANVRANWVPVKKWLDTESSKYLQMSDESFFKTNVVQVGRADQKTETKSDGKDITLLVSPQIATAIKMRFNIMRAEREAKALTSNSKDKMATNTFKELFGKIGAILKTNSL